jgi:hypothetical protein
VKLKFKKTDNHGSVIIMTGLVNVFVKAHKNDTDYIFDGKTIVDLLASRV